MSATDMTPPKPPAPPTPERRRTSRAAGGVRPERRLVGIPVSPGIAIGPVFGASEAPTVVVRHKIKSADIQAESARFEAAVAQSRKQLIMGNRLLDRGFADVIEVKCVRGKP